MNLILHIFLEILETYVLGTLCMPGYAHPKWYYQLVENFCVYLNAKKQLHPPCFSGYCKDIQTSYSGHFWHAWLPTPKMKVSTCRRLCLSACHKQTSSFSLCQDITFTRILQFDWLTAFWPITSEQQFCLIYWHGISGEISITKLVSILDYFQ